MSQLPTKFLFDEGVKEILMSLFSLASTAYEVDYVAKQLKSRPEPIEQKIDALKIADAKNLSPEFNSAVDKLLVYYVNKGLPKLHKYKQVRNYSGISDKLFDFIKYHEKFSPYPYADYKQTSIGYGTKALPNDRKISKLEATRRLHREVQKHRSEVIKDSKRWGYKWTPHQIDALTSFRYNVGNLKYLTSNGNRTNRQISEKILEYDKAGGKSLPGLTKRRKAESQMFLFGK
jgi:lysozyme